MLIIDSENRGWCFMFSLVFNWILMLMEKGFWILLNLFKREIILFFVFLKNFLFGSFVVVFVLVMLYNYEYYYYCVKKLFMGIDYFLLL